ncbi:MAG: 30S ribosomal protein S12 methylthiotransferase RimO [Leptolinea sp.]|jgi:ribosomal protein S12 methylthiotransferase|nr:30S ribosomal protein S12 methylthiotransferase RimO [Leptolinea sp.]
MAASKTCYIESLGCAKNLVDSESMAGLLVQDGYSSVENPAQANVLVVNTCGFIAAAREESLQALQRLSARKRKGQILIAAGCLTQRDRNLVAREVPGLDGILSTRRWMDIVDLLHTIRQSPARSAPVYHIPDVPVIGMEEKGIPRVAIQGASAYLKIADGCRRPCAFCSIPLIKGPAVSRPVESILSEVRFLAENGIQEINLIAQDITDYGHDLGMHDALPDLLEKIHSVAPDIPWIRLLYAYPGAVSDRLIAQLCEGRIILPYLDIPLQHAHPDTLKRMKRPSNMDWVNRTVEKLRQGNPKIALRTTFIVGYPGETEEEFNTLLDFVREVKFDRVGVFTFSFEPGTTSESLGDPIPPELKEERYNILMSEQEKLSLVKNQGFIGQRLSVLIEGTDKGISIGRSYRDAPEIDGLVIVEKKLAVGEIVEVQITGAMAYDLTAR